MWVKICANTNLEDALTAAQAGADAVGFVFAASPRKVSVEHVAAITPHLPPSVEKIGVFVEATLEEIEAAVELASLTGVQLHSTTDKEDRSKTERLRERFGSELRILRVVHFGHDVERDLEAARSDAHLNGILVDSRTATAEGGTGIPFDWAQARATIFQPDRDLKLIAAGGLSPTNVAQAIRTLQPWGVDVASGVEALPGRKDAAKVRAFVANARAATSGSPR